MQVQQTQGGVCSWTKDVSTACPSGYQPWPALDTCTASWTSSCGEVCAKASCSNAGGTWIPLDYSSNPYTCKMAGTHWFKTVAEELQNAGNKQIGPDISCDKNSCYDCEILPKVCFGECVRSLFCIDNKCASHARSTLC